MKLEILLATMNQPDDSLLDTMGVASDVIVCNQNTESTGFRRYERKGRTVRWYDFQEKGVGLNRNNALHRAQGDICLLADDDVVYYEGYEAMILSAFERFPKADLIFFNIESPTGEKRTLDPRPKRVSLLNCGRYGAVRIAFRRMSVIKHAVSFNQLFGGGCMFTAGEDTMFIRACLKKGLRAVAVPDCILHWMTIARLHRCWHREALSTANAYWAVRPLRKWQPTTFRRNSWPRRANSTLLTRTTAMACWCR